MSSPALLRTALGSQVETWLKERGKVFETVVDEAAKATTPLFVEDLRRRLAEELAKTPEQPPPTYPEWIVTEAKELLSARQQLDASTSMNAITWGDRVQDFLERIERRWD